jgi:hypothetical protein
VALDHPENPPQAVIVINKVSKVCVIGCRSLVGNLRRGLRDREAGLVAGTMAA